MISYHVPKNTRLISKTGAVLIATPEGGRVMLDKLLLELWQMADGQSLEAILQQASSSPGFRSVSADPITIRAGLACLAEAGLLEREAESETQTRFEMTGGPLVSVVIVDHNSRTWLEVCLPTLAEQRYQPFEVILIDNGSNEKSASWVETKFPWVKVQRCEQAVSLARALNLGVQAGRGEYFLLLNPDITLAPDAIAQMIAVAKKHPQCAAVAAKLRFSWAPGFLNGLGNYVGAVGWGADGGLGHLDLEQFDHWQAISSACFAAALVPAFAWQAVGQLDEGFPMYYEDSEWCYRARLFGFTILAAQQAVVYHAFSGKLPTGERVDRGPMKLERVVFGRLRFISRLNGKGYFWRFFSRYILEDVVRVFWCALGGQGANVRAYLAAWNRSWKKRQELLRDRRIIQARRKISDEQLYAFQTQIPAPLVRNGVPQLTWDIVCSIYLPLIISGKTRRILEFTDKGDLASIEELAAHYGQPIQGWRRLRMIWRVEGFKSLLYRLGRELQHRLARP